MVSARTSSHTNVQPTHPVDRRLVAILAADVSGYSRLIGADEEGTLAVLQRYLTIVDGVVARFGGRIFSRAGDGIMTEFGSPVEAVRAALSIQTEIENENSTIPQDRQIHFRIGVHLGDVVIRGDGLAGDAVNVAARLENLAEATGIWISVDVFRQVRHKVDASFESLGERRLKNIVEPIAVYRVEPGEPTPWQRLLRAVTTRHGRGLAALLGLLAVVGAIALAFPAPIRAAWHGMMQSFAEGPTDPSIAVLPLKLLDEDSTRDYLSEGLTVDITGELSRFKNLFVVASNSAFTYKDKVVDVKDVGRALGVRYLLQGTVRNEQDRVRISTQLVDTTSGRQIWSDRYDGRGKDIFEIQDDIVSTVVARLAVNVGAAEKARIMQDPTNNPEALDHFWQGRKIFDEYTREGNQSAIQHFKSAIALDKDFAQAYSWLAYAILEDYKEGWASDPDLAKKQAVDIAQEGVDKAKDDYYTHWTKASVLMEIKDKKGARDEYALAIALNSNDPDLLAEHADLLSFEGNPDGAIAEVAAAKRLNPNFPDWYDWSLALAYFQKRDYATARDLLKGLADPANEAYLMYAICEARLGKPLAPADIVKQMKVKDPDWDPSHLDRMPFQIENDQNHWREGLVLIGIPGL